MFFVTFLKTPKNLSFPSVWNGFDHFYDHSLSSKSMFYLRLVTKTELSKQPRTCKYPDVTARFNTSKTRLRNCESPCNYDAKVSLSRNPAPVQRNASPFLHNLPLLSNHNVIEIDPRIKKESLKETSLGKPGGSGGQEQPKRKSKNRPKKASTKQRLKAPQKVKKGEKLGRRGGKAAAVAEKNEGRQSGSGRLEEVRKSTTH